MSKRGGRMELSTRMQAVAELVTPGNRLADIGTDHGYVPIYLVQHGIVPQAIAMDVRKGPLSHATANIVKYGLSRAIETRLSDGLYELKPGEADTITIAGMGGLLTVRILEEGQEVLETVKECILQPQSDVDCVRRFLHEHGFRIVQEDMVIDDGKYYVMMKAVHGEDDSYDTVDDLYGKILMDNAHPVLKAYLEKEDENLKRIVSNLEAQSSEKSRQRLEELRHSAELLHEALERIDGYTIHK